jgi:Xaa-Pro aminopeptidase
MMRLHTNWTYLEQEFGCSIRDRFLMAVRSLDNPKAVTPFMLERGDQRFGLFLHVEKGNVGAAQLPPDITPIYYRPYFTFEPSEGPPNVYRSLVDALQALASGERALVVDGRAPLTIARELASSFTVEIEEGLQLGTVSLRQVSCFDTVSRLGAGRPAAALAARRLLAASPVRDRLLPYLERHDDIRFSALDAAMATAKIDGLIVSSALNLQEIAGVPVGQKHRPLAAFYISGEKHAWVLEHGRVANGREFPSPAAALRHVLPHGRIGVEEEDVSMELASALELDRREQEPAGNLIRRWRDENALPDLPYYIIATRITRHAIEAALNFTATALRSKSAITEMDPYAVYLRSMREFACTALEGVRVARTLTNFHTGARTIFPANAAPYPVDERMNTLKIDAGCLLLGADGILLGCSDIARTLSVSDAGEELYTVFKRGVRNTLIPAARAGRTGEAVHAEGVDVVWGRRQQLSANPLFVDLAKPADRYDRDVGHLLGKNNLAHLRLVRGDRQPLREGMVACCEYQWPLRGNAIAYEDTCLVTPAGGLNITSDEG